LAEELTHYALRRSGVFVRKPEFLEKALAVRRILLDKTGTLTLGHLTAAGTTGSALAELDPRSLAVLTTMVVRSNHPVSRCLVTALAEVSRPLQPAGEISGEGLQESSGRGLELQLPDGIWRLGRPDFALTVGPAPPLLDSHENPDGDGATVFSRDGRLVARFHCQEEYKIDAAEAITRWQATGFQVYLLSGDAQAKVDRAAVTLGIPLDHAQGDLSPEQKAERVAALDRNDTLMVGDGLNDSPSFAVALCAATPAVDRPVLPGKADFYFLGDGIAAIGRALQAAHFLRRVVRDNLAFAVLYNVFAIALCLAALVTPVVAAILMPISSVAIVSWTALRLRRRRSSWT
jgi:Cu2+-exporting ATPase